MSPDAAAFVALLERSRVEEMPGRKRAAQTTTNRVLALVPFSSTNGVTRDEILTRMARWGHVWTRDRLTVVVDELVGAGVLVRGGRGIHAPRAARSA